MCLKSNIKGFQHLGLPVRDIEKSKNWYISTLGFELVYQTQFGSGNEEVKVAFIKLGNFVIEMYQPSGDEFEEIKGRGHGHFDHIALDVDNIEAIYEKLERLGINTIEGKPRYLPFWENGVKFLTILGPNEEKIEFNQKL